MMNQFAAMEGQFRVPDFFIVGAPRCGTTALYTYLRDHSEIFMSPIKEPDFFADFLGEQRRVRTLPEYLECFAGVRGEKRIGEASVAYLASHTSARVIKEFSPLASIIIMLRNPVDVMYSMYYLRRFSNLEDEPSFEAALEADARGRSATQLTYRERANFATQVDRYISVFGREKIHFIIYDDFKADTKGAFRNTLRFLGVDSDSERKFPRINGNRRVRSRFLWCVLRQPPKPLRRIIHPITSRRFRSAVGGYLLRLNAAEEPRPPIEPELRDRLQKEFAPEIHRLSRLLDRDLTAWCHASS
jgi:sulfotransferase family protein